MNEVFIIGAGQTPVAEHWDLGLRDLGTMAIRNAMADAGVETVDALFVGNMLGGAVNGQENLGALLADAADLLPAEAWKVEAVCASGGAAVRAAAMSVAAGIHEVVVAIGIEKMTDAVGDKVAAGLATASDGDYEASHGLSFVALSALMMRRYMHETSASREEFAPFAVNAHRNAALNANAMFREPISAEAFARSPLVAAPIGVLDAAPVCDGAAAVVICSREFLQSTHKPVRIAAAAGATDTIGLAGRPDLLTLGVAKFSADKAYAASGFGPKDIDFFEAHDAFTIITTLSLEACGFAPRGEALKRAAHGCFGTGGCVPVSTFGGLKARGHPVGASGTYQIVEATMQLRGEAGPNQVPGARVAMTQSIGGHGSIAFAHILEA
ncbi:MAG TPA: thiolase domain-containing protein [Thermoanaerobaculia bacterium]|jgi:acetyl-CoA C-acetyltransferase|nr:thiolase domain-containing protein [Thermoanaerobaculia bacterium]